MGHCNRCGTKVGFFSLYCDTCKKIVEQEKNAEVQKRLAESRLNKEGLYTCPKCGEIIKPEPPRCSNCGNRTYDCHTSKVRTIDYDYDRYTYKTEYWHTCRKCGETAYKGVSKWMDWRCPKCDCKIISRNYR